MQTRLALATLALLVVGACDDGGAAPGGATLVPGSDAATSGTTDGGPTGPGEDGGPAAGSGFTGGPGSKPGGTGENHPPSLFKIGAKAVSVGETLVITLKANDPDGDPLVFSVFGELPDGSKFSKASKQLVWTPEKAGVSAFVTFVVSDGQAFDRETVELSSVAEKANHPPAFDAVSDQSLAAGEPFTLQLQASDLDGDPLTYSMEGDVPVGATLDQGTGLFAWTPAAGDDGKSFRVHFIVSDGDADASVEVNLVVGGAGAGSPPAFEPLATQKVGAGSQLQFEVKASDPDGDTLTYSVKGGLPDGASFKPSIRVFTWTPAPGQAGKVYEVTFQASDGTFAAVQSVDILVGSLSGGGSCTVDAHEPNDTPQTASTLGAGKSSLSLCDQGSPDVDWFLVKLGAGQTLVATAAFDPKEGDIDLDLYDPAGSGTLLTQSSGVTGTEQVTFTSQAAGSYLLAVYGVGQEEFATAYELTIDKKDAPSGGGSGCKDDGFEDNDEPAKAAPLTGAALNAKTAAHLCPGDPDAYRVELGCAAQLTAQLGSFGGADLDLYLFSEDDLESPVDQSVTYEGTESVSVGPVESPGAYVLLVSGYPLPTLDTDYTVLLSLKDPGCKKDTAEPNDTKTAAYPLTAGASLQGMVLCCDEDWFSVKLAAGDKLTASTTVDGSAIVELFGGTKPSPLATATGQGAVKTLVWTAETTGTVYLGVRAGTPLSSYDIAVGVEEATGPAGCTSLSCPKYQVCDGATGACVSDFCYEDTDCPGGHVCIDTYCTEPCSTDADCRSSYVCKGFEQGKRCGIAGPGQSGAPCGEFTDCAETRACLFQSDGGYCAQVGCESFMDCPADAECVPSPESTAVAICAQWCLSPTECDWPLTCQDTQDRGGTATSVCFP